jgi:TfoX/Sxy family transcriptional regulator of competence genes
MAYDEGLAERVREKLESYDGYSEKRMFGGLCILLNGNMTCGIIGDELMVRVGPHNYDDALARPHARPSDFTGKPMKGFVYIAPAGIESDDELTDWTKRGAAFARSLPKK